MKYRFEPAAETMPRAKLAALQLKRLRQTVRNAYDNVPLHRKRMRKLRHRARRHQVARRPDAAAVHA